LSRRRRAFTLTDLLVALFVLGLACALVVPVRHKSREYAFRLKCGGNLRAIGEAILHYSNANRGNFPRTRYVPGAPLSQYTGAAAPDPFAAGGPAVNDVTAPFFLLVRAQGLDPQALVCPTTSALVPWSPGGNPVTSASNLPSGLHLGYSVTNPYPDAAAVHSGYRWNSTLGAEFAIVGDMNPGGEALTRLTDRASANAMREGNSLNEARRGGQMVLYGDGHAEFQQNPFCGTKRDNIFTVAGSTDGSVPHGTIIWGSPAWAGDSVLLPVATIDPKGLVSPWEINERRDMIARGTTWVILMVLLIGIGVRVARKRRAPAA
jgi:type II secretory pathway pseudopilin PulG